MHHRARAATWRCAHTESEGKHTPGNRRSSIGRVGTPNSADRTGTFTFNASQNMDDVTAEVPTMTENITGMVPSRANLLSAVESPLGYTPTPPSVRPSLAALADEDEGNAATASGRLVLVAHQPTVDFPTAEVVGLNAQGSVDATPANVCGAGATPNTDGSIASSHCGFTPGDESLRMAELLRQRTHGDEALMSMRIAKGSLALGI